MPRCACRCRDEAVLEAAKPSGARRQCSTCLSAGLANGHEPQLSSEGLLFVIDASAPERRTDANRSLVSVTPTSCQSVPMAQALVGVIVLVREGPLVGTS